MSANFIPRFQQEIVKEKLKTNKLLLVQGPRKAGKKTIVLNALNELSATHTVLNCSEKSTKDQLKETASIRSIQEEIIVFYEAQYLDNLGAILEAVLMGEISATVIIICSYVPSIKQDLLEAIQQGELEINVRPPSFFESAQHFGLPSEEKLLEERLIFGSYPAVISDIDNAEEHLKILADDAIFTNLKAGERINKKEDLMKVLQYLAFHLGEHLSYNEIATHSELDNETVERYINLLVDAFVLIRLDSFHNGHRYELKKSHTFYFADNGIRNTIIRNFNPTTLRNDMSQLWQNYVIAERIKWIKMNDLQNEVYFWRTSTKQEMDFIEIKEGHLFAYKSDWAKKKKMKYPSSFVNAYPNVKLGAINRSTYWSFLTKKV